MKETTIIIVALTFLLVLSIFFIFKLLISVWKYRNKYYQSEIWKNLFFLEHYNGIIGIKDAERFWGLISKNFKEAKLSLHEVENIKKHFFDIIDEKMSERIKPLMSLKNSTLPSFRDLFPKDYKNFPFDLFEKKESVFYLIEEFEEFIELIKFKKIDSVSKFESKINTHIHAILDSIQIRLDLDGLKEPTMCSFRRLVFLRIIDKISDFSIIHERKLVTRVAVIKAKMKVKTIEEIVEDIEPPQVDLDGIEREIFKEEEKIGVLVLA